MFGLVNGLKSLSEAEAFSKLPAAFTRISSGVASNGYSFRTGTHDTLDVFEYKYSCTNEDAFTSAWIMRFYQKVYFFGISLPLISDN